MLQDHNTIVRIVRAIRAGEPAPLMHNVTPRQVQQIIDELGGVTIIRLFWRVDDNDNITYTPHRDPKWYVDRTFQMRQIARWRP